MMWPDEVRTPDFNVEAGEVTRTETSTPTSGEVVDLLAALQRSVAAAKEARGEEPEKKTAAKKSAAKKTATKAASKKATKKPPAKKAAAKKAS
jgi:DNA end-binding protein Ku